MSFNPKEVVRCDPARGVIDPQGPYVSARDYDHILALYLHIAERVSELPGGIDDLPEVRKVL